VNTWSAERKTRHAAEKKKIANIACGDGMVAATKNRFSRQEGRHARGTQTTGEERKKEPRAEKEEKSKRAEKEERAEATKKKGEQEGAREEARAQGHSTSPWQKAKRKRCHPIRARLQQQEEQEEVAATAARKEPLSAPCSEDGKCCSAVCSLFSRFFRNQHLKAYIYSFERSRYSGEDSIAVQISGMRIAASVAASVDRIASTAAGVAHENPGALSRLCKYL